MNLFARVWLFLKNSANLLNFFFTWCCFFVDNVQRRIHLCIANRFQQYGFFVAKHPSRLILFSVIVFIVTSYPLTEISWMEYPPLEFVESSLPALPTPTWFNGETSSVAVLLPISVSLTFQPRMKTKCYNENPATCSPVRTIGVAADKIFATFTSSSTLPVPFENVCYRLQLQKGSDKSKSDFLPKIGECFVTAPLTSLEGFNHISENFDKKKPKNSSYSDLSMDFMFGMPFSSTGLQSLYSSSAHLKHMCASATGHSVHFVAFVFFAPQSLSQNLSGFFTTPNQKLFQLHEELTQSLSPDGEVADDSVFWRSSSRITRQPAFLYFRSWNWLEFFPILFIYISLLGYIYFSLTKIVMVKSKAGLALGIVYGIGASFLVAVGICTRLGLTFGYFFSVTDVFPYVVVLNGLENITIMTTAVTNCRKEFKFDVPNCIAMGLQLEGFRMLKHVFLAFFVSAIGVMTGVPQIRDFFLMSLIGLCTDLFFQLVFFSAVLAIDIKRIELDELCQPPIAPVVAEGYPGCPYTLVTWPWTIIPTPQDVSGDTGRRERTSSLLDWFRSRRFTSIGVLCAILVITLLYLESYNGGVYYRSIVSPVTDTVHSVVASIYEQKPPNTTKFVEEYTNEISLASEWWRKLPQGYFQKLFSAAYGMSLTHRYLTILPPLELHSHVPLELVEQPESQNRSSSTANKPLTATVSVPSTSEKNEEPISSQVFAVVLVVLSFSVIVNLSLLLYTCLRKRFHRQPRRPSDRPRFVPTDLFTSFKLPTNSLRVSAIVNFKCYISAISTQLSLNRNENEFQNGHSDERPNNNSLAVSHTTDGLLSVFSPTSGKIHCQIRRNCSASPENASISQPDLLEESSSPATQSCWALSSTNDKIFVSSASPTVELYSLKKDVNGILNISFSGSYVSRVTSMPIREILAFPDRGDLFSLIFSDGTIEIVQWTKTTGLFTSLYNSKMRGATRVCAVSKSIFAFASDDDVVRVVFASNAQNSVGNCSLIYLKREQKCRLTALAVDSLDPAVVALGTSTGRIFLYELVPKSDVFLHGATLNLTTASTKLVYSGVMPRPLLKPSLIAKMPATGNEIARIVVDGCVCIAVNASGSVCVIARQESQRLVGTIHPVQYRDSSLSPVLDVVILPNMPREMPCVYGATRCLSRFATAHSDGRVFSWAVRYQYPSAETAMTLVSAVADSQVKAWPIEKLFLADRETTEYCTQNVLFSVRDRICKVEIPLNVSYAD